MAEKKEDAPKKEWKKPEVRRMVAGSAELNANTGPDSGGLS